MQTLISAQNSDGGWGYRGGSSWTEPTVFALLALGGEPSASAGVARGRAWLATNQREDGGFAPRPSVEPSTWVTALPVLLGGLDSSSERRAVNWLLEQTNQDATFVYRFRRWMLGSGPDSVSLPGWSWYPGTAGWVTPTALTILALRKAARKHNDARIGERIRDGIRFLMSRRCEDGGWNHGSKQALGFQAVSYPETTGLALLALAGAGAAKLESSFAAAERHWRACRSVEGLSWLELGMLAHGRPVPQRPGDITARGVMDEALSTLAAQARSGHNPFLEAA